MGVNSISIGSWIHIEIELKRAVDERAANWRTTVFKIVCGGPRNGSQVDSVKNARPTPSLAVVAAGDLGRAAEAVGRQLRGAPNLHYRLREVERLTGRNVRRLPPYMHLG